MRKLSIIQHCPIHGGDILPYIDNNFLLFACVNADLSECVWINNNSHELRRRHNGTIHIQYLIDNICKHYPKSKIRKSIISMCSKIVAYL